MCGRVRWMPSAVAAAVLVLAGCTGGDGSADDDGIEPIEVEDDEAEPESEPEPEPDPEPESGGESASEQAASDAAESDDPFAFDDPSEIDADYVDRVMAEIYPVVGDLLRDVLARDVGVALESEDYERLASVFAGPRLVLMGQNYQDYALDSTLRAGFLPLSELGNADWTTVRVIHAESACIVAVGNYDLAAVTVEPYEPSELTAVVLEAVDWETRERGSENPSGWRIHEQAQLVRGEDRVPVDESELSGLDYEAGLSLPCVQFEVRP
jgi:hypothetical protein